jgi:hypothetical protein
MPDDAILHDGKALEASVMARGDESADAGRASGNAGRSKKPKAPERLVAHVPTVAFQGIDVLPVDVQVQMGPGMPAFTIAGLK